MLSKSGPFLDSGAELYSGDLQREIATDAKRGVAIDHPREPRRPPIGEVDLRLGESVRNRDEQRVGAEFAEHRPDLWATVGGGQFNEASGRAVTVGGGSRHEAGGESTIIGGGEDNVATGEVAHYRRRRPQRSQPHLCYQRQWPQ